LKDDRQSGAGNVSRQPDVFHVTTTVAAAAVLRETRAIRWCSAPCPIRSAPVSCKALPAPGGNATGFINIEASLGSKAEPAQVVRPRHEPGVDPIRPETGAAIDYYLNSLQSADSFRDELAAAVVDALIPPMTRRPAEIHDANAYGLRYLIECFINKIKYYYRRVATRYEKTARELSIDRQHRRRYDLAARHCLNVNTP
jgi:hypothetical protein